jgi:hypothetical protein
VLAMLDEPEAVAREMGQFLLATLPGPATDRHETVRTDPRSWKATISTILLSSMVSTQIANGL